MSDTPSDDVKAPVRLGYLQEVVESLLLSHPSLERRTFQWLVHRGWLNNLALIGRPINENTCVNTCASDERQQEDVTQEEIDAARGVLEGTLKMVIPKRLMLEALRRATWYRRKREGKT